MSLHDRIVAVLAQAQAEGSDVISIRAVEKVLAEHRTAETHAAVREHEVRRPVESE